MTRDEKLVILTELVKEDAITLEEAFGLAEDCEIEIGEFDDEDEEEEEEEEETKSTIDDVIARIQAKMKEIDKQVKKNEHKPEKIMTFTEWLEDKQKESKKK
jgi:translation initiation factor 2B subunit (eIF-2B alpha/beta/delta family)